MARQKEMRFLSILGSNLRGVGAFWHKIGDSAGFLGSSDSRFEPTKPFDSVVVYRGIPVAIEAKHQIGYKAFGLRHMRPSQIEGLSRFQSSGGVSLVLLNITQLADKAAGIKRINRMLIFRWNDIVLKKDVTYRKAELEAMPFDEYSKGAYPLERLIQEIINARKEEKERC